MKLLFCTALPLMLGSTACASDPYLSSTLGCVGAANTRAEADACRAKLQDAAAVHVPADGGRHE